MTANNIKAISTHMFASIFLIAGLLCTANAEDRLALDDCPDKPNCVSSQASDPERRINAIRYTGEREAAMKILLDYLDEHGRYQAVKFEQFFLKTVHRSALFGFVDDVEFLFDHSEPLIHVRSASRVGHYDFGANRRRVEALRAVFEPQEERGSVPAL